MEHRREPMGGEVDSDQVVGLPWTNDSMIGSDVSNCEDPADTSNITFGSVDTDLFVDDLALKVSFLLLNLEENESSFVETAHNPSPQSKKDLDFRTLQHSSISKGSCSNKSGLLQSSNKSYECQRKPVYPKIKVPSSQSNISKSYQLPKIVVNEQDLNHPSLDAQQECSNKSKIDACASYKVFTNTLQDVSSRVGQNKSPECEESPAGQNQLSLKSYLFSGGAKQISSCNPDYNSRNQSRVCHHSNLDTRQEYFEKEAERSWSEITVKAESFTQPRERQMRMQENTEQDNLSLSKSSHPTETDTTHRNMSTQISGVNVPVNKSNLSGKPKSRFANESKLSAADNGNMSHNSGDCSSAKPKSSDADGSRVSAVGCINKSNASLNLVAGPTGMLTNTFKPSNIDNRNTSIKVVASESSRLGGMDSNSISRNVVDYYRRPGNVSSLRGFGSNIASLNIGSNTRLAHSFSPSGAGNNNIRQNISDYNRRLTDTSRLITNNNSNTLLNVESSNTRLTNTSDAFQNVSDYNSRFKNASRLSSMDNSLADYSNSASLTSCSRSMSRASVDDWRLSLFEPSRSDFDPIGRDTPPLSASSVASSRRLEWDNGADIGYSMDWPSSTTTLISNSRTIPEMARSDPEGISLMNEAINVNLGPSPTVFPYLQLPSGPSSVKLSPNSRMSSQDSSLPNPDDFSQGSNAANIDEDFSQDSITNNLDENFCHASNIAKLDDCSQSSSVANLIDNTCQISNVVVDFLERSSSPGSLSRTDSKRSVIYNSVRDMHRQADSKIKSACSHSLQPFKNMSCPNLTDLKKSLEVPNWSLSKSEEQVVTTNETRSSLVRAFLSSGYNNQNVHNFGASYLSDFIGGSNGEEQSSFNGILECNSEDALFTIHDAQEGSRWSNPQTCRTCRTPLSKGNHQGNPDLHYSNPQNLCKASEKDENGIADSVYGIAEPHESMVEWMEGATNDLQYVTDIPKFDDPHSTPVLVVSNNSSEIGVRNFSKIVSNFFQNSSVSDQAGCGGSEVKPHIRWYPFTPTTTVQDIKDVSTQTAVSFVAQQSKDAGSFVSQITQDSVAQDQRTPSTVVAHTSKDTLSLRTQTLKSVMPFSNQPSNDMSVGGIFEQHTSSPEDVILEWIPGHFNLSQMQSFMKEDDNLQEVTPFQIRPSKQNEAESYSDESFLSPNILKSEPAQASWNQWESMKGNAIPPHDGGKSETCQSCHEELNASSLSSSKDDQTSVYGTFGRLDSEPTDYSRVGLGDVACGSSNETLFEANNSSVLLQNSSLLREERKLGVGECQTVPKTLLSQSMSSPSELKVNSPVKNSIKSPFPNSAPTYSVSNIRRNIPPGENASTGTSSYVQNLVVTLNQHGFGAGEQQKSINTAISNRDLQENIETFVATGNKLQEPASGTKRTENNAEQTAPRIETCGAVHIKNGGITFSSNTQNRFVASSSNLLEFLSHNRPLSDSKYLEHNEGIPKSSSDPLLSGPDQNLVGLDQDCRGYGQDSTHCAQYLAGQDQDRTDPYYDQDLIGHNHDWTDHDQVLTAPSQNVTGRGQDFTDQDLTSEEDADLVTFQSHAYSTFEDSELQSGDDSFPPGKHIRSSMKKMHFGFGEHYTSNQNAHLALRLDDVFGQNLLLEKKKILSSKFEGVSDFPCSQSTSAIADLAKTTMHPNERNRSLPAQSWTNVKYVERDPPLDPFTAINNFDHSYKVKVGNGYAEMFNSKTSQLQGGLSESFTHRNSGNPFSKEVQVQTEAIVGRPSTGPSQSLKDFNKQVKTGGGIVSKTCIATTHSNVNSKVQTENEFQNTAQLQEKSSVVSNFTKSLNPSAKIGHLRTGTNIDRSTVPDNLVLTKNSVDKAHPHVGIIHDKSTSTSQLFGVQNEEMLEDMYASRRNIHRSIGYKLQTPSGINVDKSTMTIAPQDRPGMIDIHNQSAVRPGMIDIHNQSVARPGMIDIHINKISPSRKINVETQAGTNNIGPLRDSRHSSSKLEIADICTNKSGPSGKMSAEMQAETNNRVPHGSFDKLRQKIDSAKRDPLAPNSNFVSVGIQASGSMLWTDRCSFCHLSRNSHFSRCPQKDRFKDVLNQTLEMGLPERRRMCGKSGTSFCIFSKVCFCCSNKSLQEAFNIHRAGIVERIEARQKEVETKIGRSLFSTFAPPLYQQKNKPRLKQAPVRSTASQPHSNKENIRKTKKNYATPSNSSKQRGHQKNLNKYNRFMSKIYSQRLKSEILKGKVSFSRHEILMNS